MINLTNQFYFNPYMVPFVVTTVLYLLTGGYVLKQNVRSPLNISFSEICLSMALWLAFTALMLSTTDPQLVMFAIKALYFGVSFISVSIYTYSSIWLKYAERQKRIILLGHVLGMGFTLLIWFTPWVVSGYASHLWGRDSVLTAWGGGAYLVFFAAYMVLFFRNFLKGYREAKDPLLKRQSRIVLIAFFIAYLGALDFLPSFGIPTPPVGAFSTLVLVCALTYTIIRYKLLDIQTVIHKTIMWFATSSVFWAPIIFFIYIARNWLVSLHPIAFLFVISCGFILFALYAQHIQPRIDHLFQRRQWNLMRAFEQFTDELVHLRNLDEVVTHILTTVQRLFYVPNVSLLIRGEEAADFVIIRKETSQKKSSYSMQNVFLKWLEVNDAIVIAEYLGIDPRFGYVAASGKGYFENFHALLCVPLVVNKKLIGILNIGQKQNLRPFSSLEIAFLSDLRRSAAIALTNSLHLIAMQENLRKWNEELEKKVDERTRQLQETQAQLVQAEKLATIGTLAGGVAHEINNPLTAVLTNAQILKMSAQGDDLESLSLIEEGAKRCQAIIQKLMKYARKPAEPQIRENVDVNKVVANMAAFLEYQLRQDNIQLITEGKVPIGSVKGNANELEQVVTNLVLNAKDAIKQTNHEGKVVVRTFEENGSVGFVVSDNGVGIPSENLPKIFDPFFTTKEVGKGTGLGLAISHGIIQKHNGRVAVDSEYGKGTTFTITLPKELA